MHISDHILEKFALNDRTFSKSERVNMHRHIQECDLCRDLFHQFTQFWTGPIALRSRLPDHHSDIALTQPMVLAAATSTVKAEPFTHLTNCYSPDFAWSVQMFRDNADGSYCVFLVSNKQNPAATDPVLIRIEGVEKLVAMDADHKVVLNPDFFEHEPDWSTLQVWIVPSVGKVEFEDVHLISTRDDHLIVDTSRPGVRFALRRNPRSGLVWLETTKPGTFKMNLSDWNPDTTVWYYE